MFILCFDHVSSCYFMLFHVMSCSLMLFRVFVCVVSCHFMCFMSYCDSCYVNSCVIVFLLNACPVN